MMPPLPALSPKPPLVHAGLRTPRAAAIAGVVFSVLLITSLWMLREAAPDSLSNGGLPADRARRISVALNMIPIAGVAFMWFLGVLRDRLGAMEDKFFATVFLGSGLMFLGMMFVAGAGGGALIQAYATSPGIVEERLLFLFARSFSFAIMHIYAFKMAAVFMVTTSTLLLRTRVTAPWLAWVGYGTAAFLLLGSTLVDWTVFAFPVWVLTVSLYILTVNLREPGRSSSR